MSTRTKAILGSALFLLIGPGTVSVLIPWWITRWQMPDQGPATWVLLPALILILVGSGFLIHAFGRFAVQGLGTPSPLDPTERLVHTGVYRWVRHPMYLAIQAIILGQALLFSDWRLVLYSAATCAAMFSFVRWHEEPVLAKRFGEEYQRYRETVPGWWPRRPHSSD